LLMLFFLSGNEMENESIGRATVLNRFSASQKP